MVQLSRLPLTASEITSHLEGLPGWALTRKEDGSNLLVFVFGTFTEAMSFILRLAFDAEALDHHPELRNVYNRVEIGLSTHDAGNKITALDVELAKRIEHICWI